MRYLNACKSLLLTGRVTSGDKPRTLTSLRQNGRSNERKNPDNDDLYFSSLRCNSRFRRLDDRDLDLLGFLDFYLFGDPDRRDERFSSVLPGYLELSRLLVFLSFYFASKDGLRGGGGALFYQQSLF